MAAGLLLKQRHTVVLHARSEERAKHARTALPEYADVIVGDLASIAGIETAACRANNSDAFDAVIHNAGVGYPEPRRLDTVDGLEHLFAVNLLAPYPLTAVMDPPKRLVYLSSGLHRDGIAALDDPQWAVLELPTTSTSRRSPSMARRQRRADRCPPANHRLTPPLRPRHRRHASVRPRGHERVLRPAGLSSREFLRRAPLTFRPPPTSAG